LIDAEEDPYLRAVLVGMLRGGDKVPLGSWPHVSPRRAANRRSKRGETVVAFRSLDIFDRESATIGPLRGTPRELVMSRRGTLTSTPERVSTMYVCASSSK
jgi:hypothetical protein